MTYLIYVTLKY